jgi:hypothetical protein
MTILLIIIRSFLELPGAYTFVVILSLLLNFNALSLLFFWNHSCYTYIRRFLLSLGGKLLFYSSSGLHLKPVFSRGFVNSKRNLPGCLRHFQNELLSEF